MDVAGVVIGSIALLLAVFSSAYAAFQLADAVHFRKPLFVVDEVKLQVEEKWGQHFARSGDFLLRVRGERQPVTFTRQEVSVFPRGRSGAGISEDREVEVAPRVWTRIALRSMGIGLGDGPPPAQIQAEIYLSNPHDCYVVPLRLELSQDGSRYEYVDWGGLFRYARRTAWRHQGRLRRFIRAVSRGRLA